MLTAPDRFEINIRDDGRGFDSRKLVAQETFHYGLEIMRERANQLQGSLHMESKQGVGTTVLLRIPL
jgi:two-component system nitrate/nitrite sensor histidine kinase NarX